MRLTHGANRRWGQRAALPVLVALILCLGFCTAKAAAVQLLILGDSLTAGYGLPPSQGFQAKLAAALKAKGLDVQLVDGAVSGDTTADALARLGWVLGGGPVNAALVELGGNDGLRGLDPATMQDNLSHILDTLAAQHIPALLTGMIAPPTYGAAYGDRFKAVFAVLGKRPGVIYDPFFLQGLVGKPQYAQQDGIHPNADGVDIEVARILPLVEELVSEAKTS